MKKEPATFYRYRAFSTSTLDSLCHDDLYFASPGTFNDPLDCSPTLECDSSRDELRELLAKLIRQRVKSEIMESLDKARFGGGSAASHAEQRAEMEARRQIEIIAYLATNPEYTEPEDVVEVWQLTSRIEHELRRHYERGVCCFSTSYKNPLLWSHYGDQHRGICIGYGLDRRPRPDMQKVVYGGNRSITTSQLIRAILNDDQAAKHELDRNVLLRKAGEWRYEKEYRLIGKQGLQDSPLVLQEITFGMRCPLSVVHTLQKALSGRGDQIKFFQMIEVRGGFHLRRTEVDYFEIDMHLPYTAVSAEELFGGLPGGDGIVVD